MRLTLPDSPTRPVTNHFSKLMNKVDKEGTRKQFGVVKKFDVVKKYKPVHFYTDWTNLSMQIE